MKAAPIFTKKRYDEMVEIARKNGTEPDPTIKVVWLDDTQWVSISPRAIETYYGGWRYTPWFAGRDVKYNQVTPSKPIEQMTEDEVNQLAREVICVAEAELKKINESLTKMGLRMKEKVK